MARGKLLIALAVAGILALPFSAFAEDSDTAAKTVRGFHGVDTSKFTAKQKSDAADYSKRIADLQKEFIDKMVQNGSMTKENGEAAKQRIDEASKASQENGGIYGIMPGKAAGAGFGRKDGQAKRLIDTSKLTDQQKADINATTGKINMLYKQFITTAVSDGLITKAQGDTLTSRLDGISASDGDTPFRIMGMAGLSGTGCFRLYEVDSSKLTDQQKKDLDNYSTSLAALRKELVGKYVSAGAMTQEQGNELLKRMEQKAGPGPGHGKGMKPGGKGHFKDHAGSDESGSAAAAPQPG